MKQNWKTNAEKAVYEFSRVWGRFDIFIFAKDGYNRQY